MLISDQQIEPKSVKEVMNWLYTINPIQTW